MIQFIQTSEGRLVLDGSGGFNYEYAIKDHLGNTRVMFDEAGQVLQDQSYYPFGMSMGDALSFNNNTTSPENKYLYNGKEIQMDFNLGWYDYGARFYDPAIARFHTVDPLAENYSFQSLFAYAINNPIRFIDFMGMNHDEYSIERETGNITKISDKKYYKTESGEVKPLANGESEEGKDMVDKITNSEGESEHYTAGSVKESNESSKNKSTFQNAEEGKSFYEFAAESSDVEYGAGEVKLQNGRSIVYVGSDHIKGQTSFIGMLERSVGNDLVWASHSHPVAGGPPSYDLKVNGKRVGDLNKAYHNKLNTKYEVYDVPNKLIYSYSKNTYLRAPRGNSKPAIYDSVKPKRD